MAVGVSSVRADAVGPGTAQQVVPNPVPSANTPAFNNGTVLAIAQVDNWIVMGGTFTSITPKGGTALTRNYLVAVDAKTGALKTTFNPVVDGEVRAIEAGPNSTVYIGGRFSTVNGVGGKVAQLRVSDGGRTTFRAAPINGQINDLALAGPRLLLSGFFTTVNNVSHGGLASLNAGSGAVDPTINVNLTGHHNFGHVAGAAQAAVGGYKIALSPDQSRLVVGGNFTSATSNGISFPRDQIAMVLLSAAGASVNSAWKSDRYSKPCFSGSYDFYMRGIQFSPDGNYFAVVTTGGYFKGSLDLCDAAARFETNGNGQAIQPTWANFTGADSLYSVAMSGSAVFVGGHQRWMNNPFGQDSPGDSAVPRPGLAALDPRTGQPLAWNPGRLRGHGAEALLVTPEGLPTPAGLWVGSDTDYVGNFLYKRPKIAFFPLSGGSALPPNQIPGLPGKLYLAGNRTGVNPNALSARSFDGATAGPTTAVAGPAGMAWGNVRGAFVADGSLYYGGQSGNLYARPFANGTFGAERLIDPYNDPYWSNVQTGSGQTFRGTRPSFYAGIGNVSGMAFSGGFLYYTVAGSTGLFRRAFSTSSGVLNPEKQTVSTPGIDWSDAGGMVIANGKIYVASRTTGTLRSATFTGSGPIGALTPVAGAGTGWGNARGIFLG
jgi:hypothetical protein